MLQQATIQKKRSIRSRIATLVERHIDQSRLGENDGVNDRLLDLAGEEQCYRTVMVLIIGIMMDEFMQSWTDDQDRSPLEHRSQKQRDNLRPDGGGGILSSARLFGFWFSVHETLERFARRGGMRPKKNLKGLLNLASKSQHDWRGLDGPILQSGRFQRAREASWRWRGRSNFGTIPYLGANK